MVSELSSEGGMLEDLMERYFKRASKAEIEALVAKASARVTDDAKDVWGGQDGDYEPLPDATELVWDLPDIGVPYAHITTYCFGHTEKARSSESGRSFQLPDEPYAGDDKCGEIMVWAA